MGWAALLFFGFATVRTVHFVRMLWPLSAKELEARYAARARWGMRYSYVVAAPAWLAFSAAFTLLALVLKLADLVDPSGFRYPVIICGALTILLGCVALFAGATRRPWWLLIPAYRTSTPAEA